MSGRGALLAGVVLSLFATTAVVGAPAAPRPDLSVAAFSVPGALLSPGQTLVMRVRARNDGVRGAGPTVLALFLSRDRRRDASDVRIGKILVGALARRRSRRPSVRIRVPSGTATGRYRVLACVDARRTLREADERNNCRSARRRIVVGTPAPIEGSTVPATTEGGAAPAAPESSPAAPLPPGDDDGDGLTNTVDCAPADPAIYPGAPDPPDVPAFVDSNCDGVDGEASEGVFVAVHGNDANPGTREQPKLTLPASVATALGRGADVYVMAGTYLGSVTIANGVSIYGGYESGWTRSATAVTKITGAQASGRVEAAVAISVTEPTTLQLLTLAPKPATGAGVSSYGLRASGSGGLIIEHVVATAGAGTAGSPGDRGADGRKGADGVPGSAGSCDTEYAWRYGGAGGTNPWGRNGGGGGMNGYELGGTTHYDGYDGGPGSIWGQGGGPGGAGGDGGTTGQPGEGGSWLNGSPGVRGTDAQGGSAGFASSAGWTSGVGGNGSAGTHGHGGGGGGGGGGQVGASVDNGAGGSGGGGGAGGEGGGGGKGGQGGGGSFGIFLQASNGAVVRSSVVGAGAGGAGGQGGQGGNAGAGGLGGDGGTSPCPSQVGAGGKGGTGGAGNYGGYGGGGAGGPSIALFALGSTVTTSGNSYSFGQGGAGGGSIHSGATGAAAATT